MTAKKTTNIAVAKFCKLIRQSNRKAISEKQEESIWKSFTALDNKDYERVINEFRKSEQLLNSFLYIMCFCEELSEMGHLYGEYIKDSAECGPVEEWLEGS